MLFAILALFWALAAPQSAMATTNDCSQVIKRADAYKGVVATVSKVTAKKVIGEEAIMFGSGVRYDFVYTYPGGYSDKSFTVMRSDVRLKIINGDKMIWIPANEQVRRMYPNDDHRIPAIVDRNCRVFGIDFSTPAKQIVGI